MRAVLALQHRLRDILQKGRWQTGGKHRAWKHGCSTAKDCLTTRKSLFGPGEKQQCLRLGRDKRVLFVGSSHMREMVAAVARVLGGDSAAVQDGE